MQEPGVASSEPPPEIRSVVGPESRAMGEQLIISLTWEMHTPQGFLSPQRGAKFPLQPEPEAVTHPSIIQPLLLNFRDQ